MRILRQLFAVGLFKNVVSSGHWMCYPGHVGHFLWALQVFSWAQRWILACCFCGAGHGWFVVPGVVSPGLCDYVLHTCLAIVCVCVLQVLFRLSLAAVSCLPVSYTDLAMVSVCVTHVIFPEFSGYILPVSYTDLALVGVCVTRCSS